MIKELFAGDIEAVAKLQKDFNDGWTEKSLISALDSKFIRIFGEFELNELVGFISLGISDVLDVETIFVKKEFRRKGVALRLMERAKSLAAQLKAQGVMLEVRASNQSAINLYKRAGLKQIAVRKGYYGDGEDALVFQMEIKK